MRKPFFKSKTRERCILTCCVSWIFCLALLSCENRNEDELSVPEEQEDSHYGISFNFSLSLPSEMLTRGRHVETQKEGSKAENDIDLTNKDFRVLLFSHSSEGGLEKDILLGELKGIETQQSDIDNLSIDYRMEGKIDRSVAERMKNEDSKVAVLANWNDYTYVDALVSKVNAGERVSLYDVWCSSMYLFDKRTLDKTTESGYIQKSLGEDFFIPVFGISKKLRFNFQEGGITNIGEVRLIRAVAKIEVKAEENSVRIDNVRIRNFNTKGYFLPKSVRTQEDYMNASGNVDMSKLKNPLIPENSLETEVINLTYLTSDNTWVVYMPEFKNIDKEESSQCRLEIKFKDHDEYEPLYFCEYTMGANGVSEKGAAFDIIRNNWYRYNILRNLQVVNEVKPYSQIELDPEFGFDDVFPRPNTEGENPPWVDID